MTTPRTRTRYRWHDIGAALITCAAFVALPLAILTTALERITP